jgi:septal ring factor EnvC (AmiA/AmiB activator)
MSSDFDDIRRELKASQNDLDEANSFLLKQYPRQSEERKSLNRSLVAQNKVTKEIYVYLERLFRIAEAHRLQMSALYESIMSLPEVKASEELQKEIRARFQAVRDTQL